MRPPAWWLCSRTSTRWPRRWSSLAGTSPASPAPTTIASYRDGVGAEGVAPVTTSLLCRQVVGVNQGALREVGNRAAARQEHGRAQLLDHAPDGEHGRLDRLLGRTQERQRQGCRVGAEGDRLGDLDAVADPSGGDDDAVGQDAPADGDALGGGDPPAREQLTGAALDRVARAQALDPGPGGAARARDLDAHLRDLADLERDRKSV